jgi:hypothetical protein
MKGLLPFFKNLRMAGSALFSSLERRGPFRHLMGLGCGQAQKQGRSGWDNESWLHYILLILEYVGLCGT